MPVSLAPALVQSHPFRQWRSWNLPGRDITLTGYSRANDKTFFHVPQLKLALDAGLVEGRRPPTVLLTHTHLDHAKDLDFLAVRPGGADIYVPAESLEYVHAHLRATTELNQVAAFDPALAEGTRLHGVHSGDEFTFGKRGTYTARVVPCRHKVPSVGYVIGDGRRTLFAYVGDTHASALAEADWLDGVPVVITECTFLDDADLERAARIGHTVWSELRPIVEAHPETLFVLIHFSLRHSDAEVVDFFAAADLPNIVVWAGTDGLLPQQNGI